MSNKYEDLIKNARMNAGCGEHMSPEEVTTLLNVVETTFAALAAEFQVVRWAAGQVYSAGYNHGHLNTADELPYASDEELLQRGNEVLIEFTDPDHSGNVTDAFLAEVRAHDLNAFIRHHSAELDAHIKNGGEQFDEKSVRIRDIIVSARLFREQIRKEAAQ
ncbi:hypothetical protein [Escherichia coli]|uniref:hypothetical protein n=1 Tax=Escherichia coli TaxID=562 RepID=UPI0021494848|nr:hypothetical protein [Escherichia coli]MCR1070190.1 hypothetical protein [Escherichia coli]MDT9418628.1 hypothetical protein [Escherichia coli]